MITNHTSNIKKHQNNKKHSTSCHSTLCLRQRVLACGLLDCVPATCRFSLCSCALHYETADCAGADVLPLIQP
eukprot:11735761-Karenia_brevis.AAC.1